MVAKKMGPSQAPICEAFIMTGDTILKTYTNKSENFSIKKTVRAADTTTPGLDTTTLSVSTNPTVATTTTNTTTSTTTTTTTTATTTATTTTDAAAAALATTKSECLSSANEYIKHAQYRVAAALEQRCKSLSLNKLSELSLSNVHNSAARSSHQHGQAACGGDINRETSREEASARVRFPVLPHEQQQQQQKRQQRHLHEHVSRQNSEDKSIEPPPEVNTNKEIKQPKDCEYSINKQVELPIKKRMALKRKQQMDQPPTPVARTATFIVTSRRQIKQDLSQLNGGQRFDDGDFSIEFKTGFLNRKRIFEARGKPTSKGQRGWRRVYIILRDLRLIVRYGQQEEEELEAENKDREGAAAAGEIAIQKTDKQSDKTRRQLTAKDLKNTIRLHHSFAKRSSTYTKREYVFHLYLANQAELLLQASSESEMNSWIDTINFASACLSSPPLPSAVSSSSKRYHQGSKSRPILPASYTKLSYWEQLTDHEERLERLKTELEEHLNEAPVKRHANKRSKTDFIDKIAYLRQKIEHYTVYLDLMQKKSNSPEAIVLSKHPQIASLTPSKEMVRSLPLNAKADEDQDKKGTS